MIRSDIHFINIVLKMGHMNGYVVTLTLPAVSFLEHNPRPKGRRDAVDLSPTLAPLQSDQTLQLQDPFRECSSVMRPITTRKRPTSSLRHPPSS